jgi:sugar phosphate isomerase/epimerase
MIDSPLISLASGVMPGASPVATVEAAIAAGFDAVGLWVEPPRWTASTTRDVRSLLRSSGIGVLDVEVIWIRPGPFDHDHLRVIDIGAELGSPNALVVSSDPDRSATIDKYAKICDHAAAANVRASLEFAPFTDVRTLADALFIIDAVGRESSGLLLDPLHLSRSGGLPEDLARVPKHHLSYAQFCDAPGEWHPDADRAAIRQEAVDDRRCPGEGALPLRDFLNALPVHTPLSIEVRSKHLRDTFPDYGARAKVVADVTRGWLKREFGEKRSSLDASAR